MIEQNLKKGLVVGCGTNPVKTVEYLRFKKSHQDYHPDNEFDTVDIDTETKPTFHCDINDLTAIQNQISNKYPLVVFERFPSEYFSERSCLAASYLVAEEGMVTLLLTGAPIFYFMHLMTSMQKSGFNTCILSNTNLMLFFKCDSYDAINRFNHFAKNSSYINQLLTYQGLMAAKDGEKNLASHFNNYVWNINILLECYQKEIKISGIKKKFKLNEESEMIEFIPAPKLAELLATSSMNVQDIKMMDELPQPDPSVPQIGKNSFFKIPFNSSYFSSTSATTKQDKKRCL